MSRIIASGASSQGFEADGSKGNAGEFLKTQGDGLPPVWGEVIGDRTLIATVDLAGASVAEFDSLFSTDYAEFEFVLETIQNTSRTFGFNAQYKKAGSWLVSAYGNSQNFVIGGSVAGVSSVNKYGVGAGGANIQLLEFGGTDDEVGLNSLASMDGVIKLSNPNLSLAHTTTMDAFLNQGLSTTLQNYSGKWFSIGMHPTGGTLEGIRFLTGNNTWSSGKIHLYGIRPL